MYQYELNKDVEVLEEILNSFGSNIKYSHYRLNVNDELIKNDFSFEILLFKFIMGSKISDNTHEIHFLEDMYDDYIRRNCDADFLLEDLFDEKWVINILGEWHVNSRFSKLIKSSINNDRLRHIISFINELSNIDFKDERKIIIEDIQVLLDAHRTYFDNTPDIQWFNEKDIIKYDEGVYLLSTENEFIRPFLNYLFAKMWSQTTLKFDTLEEKLKWWVDYYELFSGGYEFGTFLDSKILNEFMRTTVNWIINDDKLGDWEDEEEIALKKMLLENPDYLEVNYKKSLFPKDVVEKIVSLENSYYNYYHYIVNPRERVIKLLDLYFKYYDLIEYKGYEVDLVNIISKPFINCNLQRFLLRNKGKIYIDLLLERQTVLIGCIQLFNIERSFDLSEKSYNLWNQGIKILSYTLSTMDNHEVGSFILDFSMYLIDKGLVHLENRWIGGTKSNVYFSEAYKIFISKIMNDLEEFGQVLPFLIKNIEERLINIDIPMISKEFIFIFDLMESLKTKKLQSDFPIEQYNKGLSILYDCYNKSIRYNGNNRFVFDSFRINLVENVLWGDVLKFISDDTEKFIKFIKPFSKKDYHVSDIVQEDRYECCMLYKRKAWIHLLLICKFIENNNNGLIKLDEDIASIVCLTFKQYFILFQEIPELDIFNIEQNTNLHNSDYILEVALRCIRYVNRNTKEEIISFLEKAESQKLIYLLKYIKNVDDSEVLKNVVMQNIDKINAESIFYIPQIEKLIDNIIFSNHSELIQKAETLLGYYIDVVKGKSEEFYEEKLWWIESVSMRIALIKHDYDKILNSNNMFYKGIVYIESEEHKNYQMAINIYNSLLSKEKNPYFKQNLLCAYVCKVVELKNNNQNYIELMNEIESLINEIYLNIGEERLEEYSSEIFYSNVLYLYSELDNKVKFWFYYNHMPKGLKQTKRCGLYISKMLKNDGKVEEANQVIKELYKIYGKDIDILEFEDGIKNIQIPLVNDSYPYLKEVKYYISRLKSLNLTELSEVILDVSSIEILLTKIVLETCEKVNIYSPNLIYDNKVSEEDRYSILFKEFFNYRFSKCFNFNIEDQSKIGFTGNTTTQNRAGLGENDLVIKYDDRVVSVIEAIRLESVDKSGIFEHINKMFGYDIHNSNIMFFIIYGASNNPKEFWDRYCHYISNEFIIDCNKSNYKVDDSGKANECLLFKNNSHLNEYINKVPMFYTRHRNENIESDKLVIHIYIDVLKREHQEIAKLARLGRL